MLRKFTLTIIVLSLALSACGVLKTAQAFTKVGNDFMTALKDGDYETAYALCHPDLQANIGTAADLKQGIESNAAQPKDWTFSSVNANTDADKVTIATLEGNITYQDGRSGVVTLELVQQGEEWVVASFDLQW